ncbi:MAG: Type secretory pathway VirB4 component-like protein [Candidatus Saccharibacteria bacterium]|nr:Type secretory pathway VirB4 component-like protein [Candidatus Saccharibacteria bacterium]
MGKKKLDPIDIAAQQRAAEQIEVEQAFLKGMTTLRDLIAPSSLEIHSSHFRLGTKYGRTLYVYGYPREIYTGWLSTLINIDEVLDISMFIYPVDSQVVLNNLRKKVTQLEASMAINSEKGRVRDPGMEAAMADAEELRNQLQVGAERFFRYGLYVTLYADSLDELSFVQHKIETLFGQQLIFSKVASSQQEQGMNSTIPQMSDQLQIRRNMNTGAISTSFPFTSADLTQEKGVLYGINMHNNGLVIFDRFSLENANMVVFAKSGAGKSFTVKLEALRSMMVGSDVLIIDPENEYQKLSDAVGGSYIRLSLNADTRINPFDLPRVIDSDEADDALRANLVTLHGLLRLMLGGSQMTAGGQLMAGLNPAEEADLDQGLIDTYARAGITSDPLTHNSLPPTISDLYDTLLHMGGTGPALAQRLRKYTSGTFAGIFSQQSNIDINNHMVVFNIRDLEDELRPVAMYIVLSHIWNITRSQQKKRMLIVDEAWQLMKYDDSANFLFSLAKRARKYYLGLTTITQDVEDFMGSKMGRAIVANSSMQLLLKQSSSAVDVLSDVFKLTEEEKKRLANFPVGQGLFFAGQNHVHIQIQASPTEQGLISTTPLRNNPAPTQTNNGYMNPGEYSV